MEFGVIYHLNNSSCVVAMAIDGCWLVSLLPSPHIRLHVFTFFAGGECQSKLSSGKGREEIKESNREQREKERMEIRGRARSQNRTAMK